VILPSFVNLQDTNWPAEILLQFDGFQLRETGEMKKKSKAGFLMLGYRLLSLIIFLPLFPQLTVPFHSESFSRALQVRPRGKPCLICDVWMQHSRGNPLQGLHECSTNGCYIHRFLTHFFLILLPPVAVITKESTVWLPSSSLWHRMQKLTLLQQILWHVYAHLLSLSLSLFSPFYIFIVLL